MADRDGLFISAELDLIPTLKNIKEDIKKINVQLKSDKDARAQIVAGLDLNKTTQLINANLTTIAKNLKLDIGNVNVGNAISNLNSSLKNSLNLSGVSDEITKITNKLTDDLSGFLNLPKTTVRKELKSMLLDIQDAFRNDDFSKYEKSLERILELTRKTTKDIPDPSSLYTDTIKKLEPYFSKQDLLKKSVYVSPELRSELEYLINNSKKLDKCLNSIFGRYNWTFERTQQIQQSVDSLLPPDLVEEYGGLADTLIKISKILNQPKSSHTVFDESLDIEKIERYIVSLLKLNNTKNMIISDSGHVVDISEFETIIDDENRAEIEATNLNISLQNVSSTLNGLPSNNLQLITKRLAATNSAVQQVEGELSRFGQVSTVAQENSEGVITSFETKVVSWGGAIEKFNYALNNIGDNTDPHLVFDLQNIESANEGVKKLEKSLSKTRSDYNTKLEKFKNTYSAILSGKDIQSDIAVVEDAIVNLGTSSQYTKQHLEEAFNSLQIDANKIAGNLDVVGKSMNKTTNAINNYRELDTTLTTLKNSFNELSKQPEKTKNQIEELFSKLHELQAYESENGTDLKFSEMYHNLVVQVKEAQNQVKLLHQEEKADNSEAQKQASLYKQMFADIKKIHQLKKQLVSADETASQEINTQITFLESHIASVEKELQTRNLIKQELEDEKNELIAIYSNQERIASASTEDKVKGEISTLEKLKVQWQSQGVLIGDFKAKVDALSISLNEVGDNPDKLKAYQTALSDIKKEASKLITVSKDISVLDNAFSKLENAPIDIKNRLAQIKAEFEAISHIDGGTNDGAKAKAQAYENLGKSISKLKSEIQQLNNQQDINNAIVSEMHKTELLDERIKKLINDLEILKEKNSRAMTSNYINKNGLTFKQEVEGMIAELSRAYLKTKSCTKEKEVIK